VSAVRLLHAGSGCNLVPGRGPKRDCAAWERCIDVFVRVQASFGQGGEAHCSPFCAGQPRKTAADLDHYASARRSA
jgi:hypothetical protein